VALARAIVPRPQVMLLDEPFSGLDQRLRETVRTETLALLRETRATSIFVTHDPAEALEISDRILLMRDGRLVQAGSPFEIYSQPIDAAAARFFAELNEIETTVKNGTIQTALGVFSAGALANGTNVTVMIRPTALQPSNTKSGVQGYIRERRFLGNQSRLLVNFSGLETAFTSIVPSNCLLQKGQTSRFCVDEPEILIFKK
jgi:iron(III) transport system ATP-binding protein